MRLAVVALCLPLVHGTTRSWTNEAATVLEAGGQLSLAITISGVERSLLSVPVVQSFRQYAPPGDVHMVIAGELDAVTTNRVHAVYRPVSFRTIKKSTSLDDINATCDTLMLFGPFENAKGTLLQWIALRAAYQDVLQTEQQRGVSYDWIVKLRTDLVFFEAIPPVRGLDSTLVHLPSGGMSEDPNTRWTNDHLFLCPRHLCRAYYELLELWQSPLCSGDGFNFTNRYDLPAGIYAALMDTASGRVLTPNGPPTYNYTIPSIMGSRFLVDWYIVARYSLDGCRTMSDEVRNSDNTTCGLVQEFDLAYTIARGSETAGYMDCDYTLTTQAWRASQRYYPRVQEAYSECEQRFGASFNYSGSGDW